MLTRRMHIKQLGALLAASPLSAFTPQADFGAYSDDRKEKYLLNAKIASVGFLNTSAKVSASGRLGT